MSIFKYQCKYLNINSWWSCDTNINISVEFDWHKNINKLLITTTTIDWHCPCQDGHWHWCYSRPAGDEITPGLEQHQNHWCYSGLVMKWHLTTFELHGDCPDSEQDTEQTLSRHSVQTVSRTTTKTKMIKIFKAMELIGGLP